MRVPTELVDFFDASFEEALTRFALEKGLLQAGDTLSSDRFLSRSVLPHVEKLSRLFNRLDSGEFAGAVEPYWKDTGNPRNRLAAYFLAFMPPNVMRAGAVWSELSHLGLQWPEDLPFRALEFGAGPASLSCGVALAESLRPTGLPKDGNWAFLESDRAALEIGTEWAKSFFAARGFSWDVRPFHRKLSFQGSLLPERAPRFTLFGMSYFLNESEVTPETWGRSLLKTWEKHAESDALVVIIEPALKAQSRRILELRNFLIDQTAVPLQVLTPCLGHQVCGAYADPDDWCHEVASWMRPPYLRKLDQLAGLDHRYLPFTHLVLGLGKRTREEWLPALESPDLEGERLRLVSPARKVGPDWEFYICGENGKRRVRLKSQGKEDDWERGDVIEGGNTRGDPASCRLDSFRGRILP